MSDDDTPPKKKLNIVNLKHKDRETHSLHLILATYNFKHEAQTIWLQSYWLLENLLLTYGTSILEKLYTILIPQFIMHLNDGFIIPRKVLICRMQASEEKMNFFITN